MILEGWTEISTFLYGATTLGLIANSLFFLKHYRRTGDKLLMWFGWAFGLMAIERVVLAIQGAKSDAHSLVYLVRLVAFLLLIYGIIEKNRGSRSGG